MSVFVDDIGTIVDVETGVDLTTATVHNLLVQRPDRTKTTWTGTVIGGTCIRYTIVAGDIRLVGDYLIQAYVEFAGWKGRGTTVQLPVLKHFT